MIVYLKEVGVKRKYVTWGIERKHTGRKKKIVHVGVDK